MKRVWQGWVLAAWLPMQLACATSLPGMVVVTEDAPPFTYRVNGELAGPALPFIDKLMQAAGLPYTHRVYPWARSMHPMC